MKNIITFICISLFCILSLSAQIRKGSRDKIKMLKISYLTDRLKLTPDEAQKFWPIYNANDQKQFELRHKKMRSIINKFENGGLEKLSEGLKSIIFHNSLGTMDKKIQRRV